MNKKYEIDALQKKALIVANYVTAPYIVHLELYKILKPNLIIIYEWWFYI